jgi:hypothetical protein
VSRLNEPSENFCVPGTFFDSLEISGQLIHRGEEMRRYFLAAAVVSLSVAAARAQVHGRDGITLPNPPVVKTDPVVDEYKSVDPGVPTKITDPYRWLEDAKSPDTRAYIAAQNAYTAQYFAQVKMLPEVVDQMTKLLRVDFISTPTKRGDRYFWRMRTRRRFTCGWDCMERMRS